MTTTTSFFVFASFTCLSVGVAVPAFALVSDSQRAGARDLFKAGDQLQRAGQFADALDKFQRAQQVFAAPTNVLRIAECDAALGRLVESAEAYREVLRTPLPAGAPPAFQAAVDQAKAELSQVEPRVPRLTVQVLPSRVQNPQMQIDGQGVPAALIGEPMPLDPGVHKLAVIAPGYASTEQSVEIKERDTKTVAIGLNAIPGVTYAPATVPVTGAVAAPTPTGETPPPPPAIGPVDAGPPPKRSSAGLLMGAHLGYQGVSGRVPTPGSGFVSPGEVGGGGVAFGLDGGLRFGRQWYIGLTLNRANFSNSNALNGAVADATSNTTLLALVGAFVANPDKVSFYGELGLGERWFDVRETGTSGGVVDSKLFNAGEFALGLGIWIPAGRSFRFLPKISFGFDSFSTSDATGSSSGSSSSSTIATFTMLGLVGLYNLDF